jgi:hypothetical protein
VGEETTNRYFDELTRGLASGTLSRRKALKLMGVALLGGTLASIPGIAWGPSLSPVALGANATNSARAGSAWLVCAPPPHVGSARSHVSV